MSDRLHSDPRGNGICAGPGGNAAAYARRWRAEHLPEDRLSPWLGPEGAVLGWWVRGYRGRAPAGPFRTHDEALRAARAMYEGGR